MNLVMEAEKAKVSEIPISKLMTSWVISLSQGTRIESALKTLSTHNISGAPVVNNQKKLVGIISEHDLLIQAATKDLHDPISYIKNVISISPDSTLVDALLLFYNNRMKRLPVVNVQKEVVGIISRKDILAKILKVAITSDE